MFQNIVQTDKNVSGQRHKIKSSVYLSKCRCIVSCTDAYGLSFFFFFFLSLSQPEDYRDKFNGVIATDAANFQSITPNDKKQVIYI